MPRKETGNCDCEIIHEDAVRAAKSRMLEDGMYEDLSALLKHFGDPNRVRILHMLCESELCVCDIASILGITKSAVSHQLKALKLSKLVNSRRDGQIVFYTIADEHVKLIISTAMQHLTE